MAYATIEDMIGRFGETELIQISDRKDLGAIDNEAVAQAQADGDAEIDGYLQGRYSLPLSHVPPIICRLACDLYRYYLYTPRVTEEVETRYKRSIKMLEDIAAGKINLGLAADQQPATTQSPMRVSSRTRVFGDDMLEKY